MYLKQVQASQRSNVGTTYINGSFNRGVMSIVSEAAQIREMNAEELLLNYELCGLNLLRYSGSAFHVFVILEKMELIRKQYYQLTGKTLN